MVENIHTNCSKCKDYGFEFRSKYNISPLDCIDGNANAEIWIIGLNPKNILGHIETRSLQDFKRFNPNDHKYFRDFRKVSVKLYSNWERDDRNIAHLDLVKCFSENFPPMVEKNGKNNQRIIVDNCIGYLKLQILKYKPKVIICNGSSVSWEVMRLLPPRQDFDLDCLTSYNTNVDNHKFWIILSGFIGRIDNRNKRRLGMEIEQIIESENIAI